MVDPVEKLRDVQVHHIPVAFFHERLCAAYCLVLVAARSEAETRIGKAGVPDLLKHLPHGLLNQAVQGGGNAQQPDPSGGFRDFLPADR